MTDLRKFEQAPTPLPTWDTHLSPEAKIELSQVGADPDNDGLDPLDDAGEVR